MSLDTISTLQQQLQTMLGTDYNSYLEHMRDWFGQRVTKDFFDERMSSLLQAETMELHNEMMKQIIFHCNGTPAPAPTLTFDINSQTKNRVDEVNSSEGDGQELSSFVESTSTALIPQQNAQNIDGNGNRMIVYQGGAVGGMGGSYDESQDQDYITVNLVDSDALMPYTMVVQEQEEIRPILPVDWLFNADIVKVDVDDDEATPFNFDPPENYSKFALEHTPVEIFRSPGILPNITHGYDIADRLNRFPHLKPHFKQQPKDQPYLSAGASVHGRFLLKAWESGMDGGVDPNCTQLILEAVKVHIRKLVTEVVKQRRSFRMRKDKICHSIGAPYPNPYLLQGQHLIDTAYTSETTTMADVMQVPALLPTADELERIAILQISAATPHKNCRFPATRATLADLLNVIENDPGIIPYTNLRFKLLAGISQNYKGFGGSFSYDDEDDDDYDDHSKLLPICSY